MATIAEPSYSAAYNAFPAMPLQPPEAVTVSARNVLAGQVLALAAGPINTAVTLDLGGGDRLLAVVTQASVQALGLRVGGQVRAIVKAPWVVLATGGSQPLMGAAADNQLAGTVSALHLGPLNAEVALTLAGGTVLHAVVTSDAVAALGLAPGVPALALIKPSLVVLAA